MADSRSMRTLLAAVLTAGLAGGCLPGVARGERVVIGVGSTTEQEVLAALAAIVLERDGVDTERRSGRGGTVGLRRAALGGGIDAYWDYTGAAWTLGLRQTAPAADPDESYRRVRAVDEANGLLWLEPSRANATLALFVRAADLPAGRPPDMAWLASALSGGRRLCADQDFVEQRGGLEVLAGAYRIDLRRLRDNLVPAGEQAAIRGTADGRCFAALATTTSGNARVAGLVPVSDELGVFPAFVVCPVVRAGLLGDERITSALATVARTLDNETLAGLNARAERGEEPDVIAEDFLARVLPRAGT